MTHTYDICAIGNAIVDVISPCDEAFLAAEGLTKGGMSLIDENRALSIQSRMAKGVETSGGSAANTVAGLVSLGGSAAFIGKVGDDRLGGVFGAEMRALGAAFGSAGPVNDPATGRCLIHVTSEGQRTMTTYLGAAGLLSPEDVDPALVEAAYIVYLEGYLFDPEPAMRAFAKAAALAHGAGRLIALTLSDSFVVDRHREGLKAFIETQVDVLFANEAELTALFETDFDSALAALRPITRIAAVTRSEQGSVICADGEVHQVAAFPVDKVVDTTGAGDQYAAGVCYGLAHGLPLDLCGKLGSMAAAEVISHYGPRPQVPLRDLATRAGLM
jgi:sugar/nucleoside kinase (ribokinase family)